MKIINNIIFFNAYDLAEILDIPRSTAINKIINSKGNVIKRQISENDVRSLPNIDLKKVDDRIKFFNKYKI